MNDLSFKPKLSRIRPQILKISPSEALHSIHCIPICIACIVLCACICFLLHLHRFACMHLFSSAFALFCVHASVLFCICIVSRACICCLLHLHRFACLHCFLLRAALFYLHIACTFAPFCMPACIFSYVAPFSALAFAFPCMSLALRCLPLFFFIACICIRAMMLTA